ncbi:MAG: DUF1002 domain-containing protein [Oliverpabstia sp.]|nr:DUF1002 domain-containing protein [Oliverpabstia sp.]
MKIKKGIAVLMAVLSLAGAAAESEKVYADQIDAPYLALGADLSESEKSTVLNLLGVDASQLDQYMIVTVTNADEHAYLDAYLDASVIGSRALSSVVVEKKEEGTGIKVKTSNISYCTTGMYQNALATAGLENAEVRVAGPFNISGTAALVGAMKAYGEMTGETINPENADAATEELVITSELGESLGEQEQAEALIGAVKDIIVAEEVEDPQEIEAVINDTAKKMNIQLSEEDKAKIAGLMEKIGSLDLNVDALKEQAKDLYQKLEDMDIQISEEQVKGILATIISWFEKIINVIKGWLGM